jgi:hypothetical protein
MSLHPTIEAVTQAIAERSRPTRRAYLDLIARERETGVDRPNPISPAEILRMALLPQVKTKRRFAAARR